MTGYTLYKYSKEGYEIIIKTDNHEHYKATVDFAKRLLRHPKPQTNADVAPVVHGHWIIGVDNDDFDIKCSKCKWTNTFEVAGIAAVERIAKAMHYCMNCGAKMDEVSK